ncbi:hypothetical protein E2562_018893 [Oryza meyeriana var. granulata]|uniref:SOSEKI DIX-like domain-containing protein n=1 Tax=Oryza meyeriana var. granulata TaxID=110450 RepID=A0A6G1FA00_9ORYZ|nr:hypothetical protein E2562_018893 [Oryza meyeriana var. granulata]
MAKNNNRSANGWASPERRMVWTQKEKQVVAVVYYLCRQDGQLDHPHFVHVPCSASDPPRLYLRDVIARLSDLRGAAMPASYSWSAKRTYRNAGYVWHDLTADDLILPAASAHHPNYDEYVLKGSPLLGLLPSNQLVSRASTKHKHNRWTSFDLADYQRGGGGAPAAELIAIDDIISPPPSSSSPDDNLTLQQQQQGASAAAGLIGGGGRMRASAMLMHLISCGSIKDDVQGQQRLPPRRLQKQIGPRGRCADEVDMDQDQLRDYFSGSLVEKMKSSDGAELRRSSSCNADTTRGARLGEVDGVPKKRQQPPPAIIEGSASYLARPAN